MIDQSGRRLARLVAFNTSLQLVWFALGSVASIVAVGISARYLGATDYGLVVTALAFASLLQLTSDIGIEPVSIRRLSREPDERPRILSAVLMLGTATNVAGAMLAVGLAFLIFAGNEQLIGAVAILASAAVFGGGRLMASVAANSRQRTHLLSLANMIARLTVLAATAATAHWNLGLVGIVVAQASYGPVRTLIMVILVRADLNGAHVASPAELRRLLMLSLPMGLVAAITYAYLRLDLLLLSVMKGPADVAAYGLAYKVVEVLALVPAFAMAAVLPVLAREDGPTERFQRVMSESLNLIYCLAAGVLGLAAFSPQIVRALGGGEFGHATSVMSLLFLAVAMTFVQAAFGFGLVAQGLQGRAVKVALATLIVNLVLNLALIPTMGANGAALALIISEMISLAYIVRVSPGMGLASLLPRRATVLAAVLYLATVLVLRELSHATTWGTGLTLVVSLTLAGGVYAGALLALRAVPFELIRRRR